MPPIDLNSLHPDLQRAIRAVTGKRPKTVIDYILQHGSVTTEDLERLGYSHAPRAARDVRECGVPLKTSRVTGTSGKKIASYTFGDPSKVEHNKMGGRNVLPKALAESLHASQGGRCAVCSESYNLRYLTTDHRVPYEIAGEAADASNPGEFMLLCGSCQRKKSFECERCPNWTAKDEAVCRACFWVSPEGYSHLATRYIRRVEMSFTGDDATRLDMLVAESGVDVHEYLRSAALKRDD